MQTIEIITGNEEHVDSCEQMLQNSELGRRYFSAPGSGRKQIIEGMESGNLLVAIDCGEVVGFMYVLPHGSFHAFPYLHLFAVKESRRGEGIGAQMLEYLERAYAGTQLFLVCADFNPGARRFYARHGFQEVGALPGLYRDGITEYLMSKRISGE